MQSDFEKPCSSRGNEAGFDNLPPDSLLASAATPDCIDTAKEDGAPVPVSKAPSCLRFVIVGLCLGVAGFAASSGVTLAGPPAGEGTAITHASVQARYDRGKMLAQSGDPAGALNEFLWCFDEGMVAIGSFTGVRTSFLLSDIGRLMPSYPLAREALIGRCDSAEQRALRDPKDRRAVQDFAALCVTLNDDVRLVRLFDQLPAGDARRQAFGLRAFRIFLPQQRYADALVVMPYTQMTSLWNNTVKRPPPVSDPHMLESLRRNAITNGLDYIEALAGAGDLTHAREMIDLVVDVDASRETQRLLEERLKRAGHPDLLKEPEIKK